MGPATKAIFQGIMIVAITVFIVVSLYAFEFVLTGGRNAFGPNVSQSMLTDERLAAISNAARQQCQVFGAPANSPAMSQCVGIFLAGWMERDRLDGR